MLQTIEEQRFPLAPIENEDSAVVNQVQNTDNPPKERRSSVLDATLSSIRRRLTKLSLPSKSLHRSSRPPGQENKPPPSGARPSSALITDTDDEPGAPGSLSQALTRRWSPYHGKPPMKKRSQSLRSTSRPHIVLPKHANPPHPRRLSTADTTRPVLIRRRSSLNLGVPSVSQRAVAFDGIEIDWLARLVSSIVMGPHPAHHPRFEAIVAGLRYNIQRLPVRSRCLSKHHLCLSAWYILRLLPKPLVGTSAFSSFDSITLVTRVLSLGMRFSLTWLSDYYAPISHWFRHYGLAASTANRLELTALEVMGYSLRPPLAGFIHWLDRLRFSRGGVNFPNTMETIRAMIDEITPQSYIELDLARIGSAPATPPSLRLLLLTGLIVVGPMGPTGPQVLYSKVKSDVPGVDSQQTESVTPPLNSSPQGTLVGSPECSTCVSGSRTPTDPVDDDNLRKEISLDRATAAMLVYRDDKCAIEDDSDDEGDS